MPKYYHIHHTSQILWNNILIMLILCGLAFIIQAMPPPNPVVCDQTGCTLYNSYGVWNDRKDCHVSAAVYPATEEELISAVANANKNKLKVKVVSKFSHTIPKFACPASGNQSGILISTERYNSNIEVDVKNLAVTADAGVGLRALIDRVQKEDLSLVVAPYWEGVSVAGMISTGAHGSSWLGKGGAVHDHVIGIRLIVPAKESEGFAKVLNLRGNDPLLSAAKVSLGMLGVISKVTFSLEHAFKRSITFNFTSDDGLEDELMEHGKKYEFGDIQWYPSKHTAVYRYDDRVPLNTSGDGVNDFIGFQPNYAIIAKSVRASEKAAEKSRSTNAKCVLASTFLSYKKLTANGLKNNNLIFTNYPVIGHNHKMQSSGSCLYSTTKDTSCAWDPRLKALFFYESTAIFPSTIFPNFIRDIKKLRDLNPQNFCGADLYNGFLIRYVKKSDAYLGQSEDSVVVDFNYYRADEALTPRLGQDVWEEVEQIAFFKYGAKPHWGKNRDLAFFGVSKKYFNFGKFVEAKKRVDPNNVFSGGWGDEVLFGGGVVVKEDGCALEGQCVCSEDRHCSPEKGYFCQRGVVYEDARVCRFSTTSENM